jgi:hypothetical protein
MYIKPNWHILTIGDGDLSFSASLWARFKPRSLTATILDDLGTLASKYGDDANYQSLVTEGCQVLTCFDVTDISSWEKLTLNQFDLVIFQFPLIPAFTSKKEYTNNCTNFSVNTLNRRLLRKYLQNSFTYFLAESGAGLAYISSKEVKPYIQWNIESSLIIHTPFAYLGKTPFIIDAFPGYKIRNVDRNKHVKDTLSFTYIYTKEKDAEQKTKQLEKALCCPETESINSALRPNHKAVELITKKNNQHLTAFNHCSLCDTGLFTNEVDKQLHLSSKKHQQMALYNHQWLEYLAS